jgi:hypothetical protein
MRTVTVLSAICLLLCSVGAPGQTRTPAEPGDPGPLEAYMATGETTNCLYVPRITRTEVIDNQTILFHIGRRNVYMNRLPRSCPGLARERAFSYQVRTSQLCNVDIIRVLDPISRRSTAACGLGQFERLELRQEFEECEHEFEFDEDADEALPEQESPAG